jgi:hypothetical protein
MQDDPASTTDEFQAYKNFLMLVGDITTRYAAFEHIINETIWLLCNLDDRRGGCITSEIISLKPRFNILIALLYELKFEKRIISETEDLLACATKTVLFRNKYAHTPINLAIKDGELVPMIRHIKIEKTLKDDLREYDFEEMLKTSKRCQELTESAKMLRSNGEKHLERHHL